MQNQVLFFLLLHSEASRYDMLKMIAANSARLNKTLEQLKERGIIQEILVPKPTGRLRLATGCRDMHFVRKYRLKRS